MLTSFADDDAVYAAIMAGAAGYLLKDRIGDVKEFVGAVRRVAEGGSAIDPIIVSTLLSRRRSADPLAAAAPAADPPGARAANSLALWSIWLWNWS